MKRRRFLGAGSAMTWASLATLSACGGGGGGEVTPAPAAPTPAPTPAPSPGVAGPAWFAFGRDPQHSAVSAISTQDLNRIAWLAAVDLAPQYQPNGSLLIHYGSPVITSMNTVIFGVKTGPSSGFRVEARAGGNGGLLWMHDTDYVMPAHNWMPSYNITLTPSGRLYAPDSGGRLMVRADPNDPAGTPLTVVFYGAAAYDAAPVTFNATVFINTPITSDSLGNLFFGFVVTGTNPAGLVSGLARVDASGSGTWIGAAVAASDSTISKVATNCAPALSPDGATVYVAVNIALVPGTRQVGYLLALNSTTLAVRTRASLLDPVSGQRAAVSDNGTSSPAVGSDGRVFFGVLENPGQSHNARGWMLQFDPVLAGLRTPGSFGWDVTPTIIPSSMVAQYTGSSLYLLALKYNNYLRAGSGDGRNRLAVIDPNDTQTDAFSTATVMKEVITIVGPTFVAGSAVAVEEWCINTMAADPTTSSILANNEDGNLYRWHLPTNSFTQSIRLNAGLGQAYTPTAVGADGAVYAISNGLLYSVRH